MNRENLPSLTWAECKREGVEGRSVSMDHRVPIINSLSVLSSSPVADKKRAPGIFDFSRCLRYSKGRVFRSSARVVQW